ncbi:MAG: gamma-glutamyltransferase [Bauldia sp.]|nr:gamma-glutamyltransferase [Bauldia sp.]
MVTSPHHLASEAGLRVLRAGGNAVEAAVATAATLAVVYPHMNGIGGDGFWLIAESGRPPVGIRAAGFSGQAVDAALYRAAGLDCVPVRGTLAANTVPGTVAGWRNALDLAAGWGSPLPLGALLDDAIHYAEAGYPVGAFQAEVSVTHGDLLGGVPGFSAHFLGPDGGPTPVGSMLRQPALARTLRGLVDGGLDAFYRGEIAASIAADCARIGVPLAAGDLADFRAERVTPLALDVRDIRLFNHPPPTQGLASLIILALFDRLGVAEPDGFEHVHGLVEATKRAFTVRDAILGDPRLMRDDPATYLAPGWLDAEAAAIDPLRAAEWLTRPGAGDTVWLGAIDGEGRAVSMIQSVYLKFGSGVVLPDTGILLQNRGAAFELDETSPRAIGPRRLPFHTLNPAMAVFPDGRRMVYGSMGGDGQPQFQAALFSRYAFFGQELQAAISAPRWLLGRGTTDTATTLRIEDRIAPEVLTTLASAGHRLMPMAPYTSQMGHAGAIVRHADGLLEGASDPRSDGAAAGF